MPLAPTNMGLPHEHGHRSKPGETPPDVRSLSPDHDLTHAQFLDAKYRDLALHYQDRAPKRARWFSRNRYFYRLVARYFRRRIAPRQRILEIGCRDGFLLNELQPSRGVGIEISSLLVEQARRRYPHLEFHALEPRLAAQVTGPFDVIILGTSVDELPDLVTLLSALHALCHEGTRLYLLNRNALWHPALRLAGRLGAVTETPHRNWLNRRALRQILKLAGFSVVAQGETCLLPKELPLFSWLCNGLLERLPLFRRLCLLQALVARPRVPRRDPSRYRVSVVVPCKNEQANVPRIPARIPEMGAGTEIIFVDDQSDDATRAVMEATKNAHPDRRIVIAHGPGQGKGAAVRAGLAHATGDVYVILDADMTVMPEDLPAFYRALVEDQGEFINGTRLIYPLEDDSMRLANILGNKLFAMLFSYLLEQPITDTLCGTKMLWARDYPKILAARAHFGQVDRWGDYDWIFGAAYHALELTELPVHYVARTAGETKMTKRLRNALIMLRMCRIAFWKLKLR